MEAAIGTPRRGCREGKAFEMAGLKSY